MELSNSILKVAIDEYLRWKAIRDSKEGVIATHKILRQFCIYMRNCQILDITLDDITQWLELNTVMGYQQNTRLLQASAVKKLFEYLHKVEACNINPELIQVPRKKYKMPRVLQEREYEQILSVIPVQAKDPRHIRNRAIVQLLWDTGARCGEVCSLNIQDIDIDKKEAIIRTEKSRGRRPFRKIFWSKTTNETIKKWLERRNRLVKSWNDPNVEPLFFSPMRNKKQRLKPDGVDSFLRRYSIKAGMKKVNSHSFRHHKGRDILEKGGNGGDVMNLLGHATLASSTIYTVMVDDQLKKRAEMFL